jgi:N-acetylglucosamine-6-phosphate deacetylase
MYTNNTLPRDSVLINGILLTPYEKLYDQALCIRQGKIERIIPYADLQKWQNSQPQPYDVIDVHNQYIAPGFIDIHTHGASGIDAAIGPYPPMAEFLVQHGTTGFLPTFWNMDLPTLIGGCQRINTYMKEQQASDGARIIGINSEGPFINPERGAQEAQNAILPTQENINRILDAAEGKLKIMTVSSEIEGYEELVRTLRKNSVHVALGYCHASPPRLEEAMQLGISHIDHIFDCFADPTPSEPGVKAWGIEEEMLVCDDLYAEVIADKHGLHVPPVLLKILLRCKGIEKIILISDSRDVAGLPAGRHVMHDGLSIVLTEGDDVVRLRHGGLAGSIMSLNDAIRNMMTHTGIAIEHAVRMATYNPAVFLGINNHVGELQVGLDADLVVFDHSITVQKTFVKGKLVYQRKSFTAR